MGNSNSRRKLWNTRFKAGLCVYCGQVPFEPNKKGCLSCLKQKYIDQKDYLDKYPDTQKEYHLKIRKEVLEKYGNKCACCGETNWAWLVIDHVNNDGAIERRALYGSNSGSSRSFFLKLKREPLRSDLQVLCWNCNAAKSLYGCCPHTDKWIEPHFPDVDLRRTSKGFNINPKIKWPPIADLVKMVLETNCAEVARKLGVHDTAVRGHLKRRKVYEAVQNVKREKRNQTTIS